MARIAVIITDMFEDSEYLEPVEAYINAGHLVTTVGLQAGATVHGKKRNTPVTVDRAVSGAGVDEFDALFIPGGYSPDKLRVNEDAVAFAGGFVKSGKPVFAICHGPQLLITADVLKGLSLTGWKSIARDIFNAGAVYLDREVVEDANLITSRSPADLDPFIKATLTRLSLVEDERAPSAD